MRSVVRTLTAILYVPGHRTMTTWITTIYMVLFLVALQDVTVGGSGFAVATADWSRTFERVGAVTFEPVARITIPGVTILLAPLNILLGLVISVLVGLNLLLTYIAFKRPKACSFNHSTGILASFPALLAGGACCAPVIILILGLQLSSALVTAFQVMIPVAVVLLLVTLKLIVDRTNPELVTG